MSTSTTDALSQSTRKILIAITGSVATIKLQAILNQFTNYNTNHASQKYEIKVISTENALRFIQRESISFQGSQIHILTDEDEWQHWHQEKQVLHVALRNWADALVIAPLDANTMAKIAYGFCDNLVTCTFRAWDRKKPIWICPAMNTAMWESPVTAQHIGLLLNSHQYPDTNTLATISHSMLIPLPHSKILHKQEREDTNGNDTSVLVDSYCPVKIISPVAKKLACGDIGMGGMASPETIVETVISYFS